MLGAAALPALGAIGGLSLFGQVQTTPLVSARAEAAAGEAPIAPGAPSEATLMTELRAGAGLRLRTPRTTLQLGVEPRISYQTPNLSDLERPLVLARAAVSHTHALDRRLEWRNEIETSAGEVEYTQAELLLNTPIARQIDDPVVVAFSITGTSVLAWQGSRRYVLSVGPVVEHTTTISGDNPIVPPSTTAIGGDVTQTYTLTPYSTLSIPIAFREYIVDEREPESPDDAPPEDLDQRTLTGGLAYVHALDLRTTIEASGGVTAVEGGGEPFAVLPQGGIAMNRVVYSTRTQTISNRLAARMIAAFDPTEAQLYPTAGIEASLTGTLGADWRASLAAEAYTTVTEDPVSDDDGDSRAALNAAIGYLLTEEISLDLGVRFSTRASHFSQEFRLTDETLLGFIALSAAFELIPAEQRERTRSTRPSGARSE